MPTRTTLRSSLAKRWQGPGCSANPKDRYCLATRYHSLVLDKQSLPECFDVTAWTELEQGGLEEIMAVKHRTLPIQGVQFHPESILTEYGLELLANFVGKDAQPKV